MATQTRREKLREATAEEIKSIALTQMIESGAAALSLRAIATQMGMSAPSLYNYYKNRDELVTALIVDAYNSLGDATNAASNSQPPSAYGTRFLAVSLAFRGWALQHREQFILIYGSPIPGYHAPVEITTPPAVRATYPFIAILEEAWRKGALKIPVEYDVLDTTNQHQHPFEQVFRQRGATMPAGLIQMTMEGWGMVYGMVSLELYGNLNYLGSELSRFYQSANVAYLRRLGLGIDPE